MSPRIVLQPMFLPGPNGRLHAVLHAPASGSPSGALLFVPPFGDEMNRSRRMVAETARELARTGQAVLVVDPFGTGDSEGDFGQATWSRWCADIRAMLAWLVARGHGAVSLWGMRLGASLALAASRGSEHVDRLLLWQPVVSGATFLAQVLRVRVAATAFRGGTRETVAGLKEICRHEGHVEIGGYSICSELLGELEAMKLATPAAPVHWCEVGAGEALAPASARVVEQWRDEGVAVQARLVGGPPFWATQEISVAPELLAATVDCLAARVPR